jgi:hypothetical protein
MKTQKQVIKESGIPAKLVRATVRQLGGTDRLRDVYEHGAMGGYCGFTYYRDTCAFWKRNRKEIAARVIEEAECMDESPIAFVAGFNCLESDKKTETAIGQALYGGKCGDSYDDTQVQNALAWYALESVARAYCDE